jgi:hypothetical protein
VNGLRIAPSGGLWAVSRRLFSDALSTAVVV